MSDLTTEGRNPASEAIDGLSPLAIVRLMASEDARVVPAVADQEAAIARAIEVVADRLARGGRLVYVGAGTSGRLGVLDAAECPPTFNTDPRQVVGLIAGGTPALTRAVEGAEDHPELAVADLESIELSGRDVVVGIATSGRTPYVLGGLEYAGRLGAFRIGLSCNRDAALSGSCDLVITPVVGPEVISGSTRLKAGTATKMVLNMITTGGMVLLGKTYGNLMVDLRATNSKLVARSIGIVTELTGLAERDARELLDRSGGEVKTAVVAHHRGVDAQEARRLLEQSAGRLRQAMAVEVKGAEACGQGLVLGIDAGGTKTVAWLAKRSADDGREPAVLGRGAAGPANPISVGLARATENLDRAIAAAFADAGLAPVQVDAAVVAMAGSERDEVRRPLETWAERRRLAASFRLVSDAVPVLAAGTPEGWGVALISGTGSFAFGQTRDGRQARAGGWGRVLGDEGSGYAIALAGLRAAARAADGRGAETRLLPAMLERLGLDRPEQLIPAVNRHALGDSPLDIASLAEVVVAAEAGGDAVARRILDEAAAELAGLVAEVAGKLDLAPKSFPLALAGGVLVRSSAICEKVERRLESLSSKPGSVQIVSDPVWGAVLLAEHETLQADGS